MEFSCVRLILTRTKAHLTTFLPVPTFSGGDVKALDNCDGEFADIKTLFGYRDERSYFGFCRLLFYVSIIQFSENP